MKKLLMILCAVAATAVSMAQLPLDDGGGAGPCITGCTSASSMISAHQAIPGGPVTTKYWIFNGNCANDFVHVGNVSLTKGPTTVVKLFTETDPFWIVCQPTLQTPEAGWVAGITWGELHNDTCVTACQLPPVP